MLSVETLSLAKAYTDKIKEQLSVGFTPKIVESLPAAGQNNILYLVLKENGQEEGNIYNEYIWIDNKYEFIGNTDTSLIVDGELSDTSENPVQNKVVTAELNNKADINNPLSLIESFRKSQGFVIHDYNSGSKEERYVLNPKDGVTLDDTISGRSKIPSSYVVGNYVKESVANKADISNPLQLSDTDLQKTGLIAQSYQAAGSTPGTVGTRTYAVIERDSSTLDDTISGVSKVPSSYAVGQYVKTKVAEATPIKGTDYFTEADKQEIIDAVIAALSNNS